MSMVGGAHTPWHESTLNSTVFSDTIRASSEQVDQAHSYGQSGTQNVKRGTSHTSKLIAAQGICENQVDLDLS